MIWGENMVRPVFPLAILITLAIILALVSGCTGQGGGSQPPVTTPTIPTPRITTPRVTTSLPLTTRTTVPVTTGVTPSWTPGSIVQEGAAIQIRGDIVGYKAPQANYLDEIRFTVVLAPRAEPVTFEIPNTQIVFTKPGIPQYGVNYRILSGDVNNNLILEEGETFLVSIKFTSDASQNAIYAGQAFTMAIQNPPQRRITLTTEAPPTLTEEPMVLATGTS
ncbi:MAG: hypothetical protein ACM3X8_00655 [Methanomicrobiales archaeon]